jgi:hypothetical protein
MGMKLFSAAAAALLDPNRSHRVEPRRGAPVEVQVMGRASLDVLVARNVSQTGIGVYVPHAFIGCNLEEEVALVISLPGERSFLARGIIMHRTESGEEGHHFGLRFTKIGRPQRAKIRDYVRSMSR